MTDYDFDFPEDTDYEEFRLILRGLAAVMEDAARALQSGMYGDAPKEELVKANEFQFDLLKENPEVAELILDEVEDGDTVAVGDVDKLREVVDGGKES